MLILRQTPGLVDVYEAPRLMRVACMFRSAGWVLKYAWRIGKWRSIHWRELWWESSRHRWSNYWCCDGHECGCYGISTAEYYTGDDWQEVSYDEWYLGKGTEDG